MKKAVIVLVLATILATGTVFADHPEGWGLGLINFVGSGYRSNAWHGGWAFSLKAPNVPIFWAIDMGFGSSHRIGVSGDWYFIDKRFSNVETLHWYLGVGGYVGLWWRYYWLGYSRVSGDIGARFVAGLSWQPLDCFELFGQLVPSIGIGFGGFYGNKKVGVGGNVSAQIGVRAWLK